MSTWVGVYVLVQVVLVLIDLLYVVPRNRGPR